MDLRNVTRPDLAAMEGQTIANLCTTGFTDASLNHCAHFVSHALDITVGMRCGSMKYATRGQGGSIRVNEVFNYCIDRGAWADRNVGHNACLIFVTLASNVQAGAGGQLVMGEHPRKHIGIHFGGDVWHYSNGQDKVIRESVSDFETRFRNNYGSNIGLYHGYRQDI
jgi:hypothetical protein